MNKLIGGLNVIRAYEISWLNNVGLPQIAVLEIYQDYTKPSIDTWQLKEFLVGINNSSYIDLAALKTAIEYFLHQDTNCIDCDIKIIPQQNFTTIEFTQNPKLAKLPNVITKGTRFICQQTEQPFIGTVTVYYANDIQDADTLLGNILHELRNKKFTTQSYAAEVMQRITQLQFDEFAFVINLNRRGGISQAAIRSNTAIDFSSLSQRGILE